MAKSAQIRIYDNQAQRPLRDYVKNDIQVWNSDQLVAFQRDLIKLLDEHKHKGTDTEIPACQYIVETYARYTMLANCLCDHEMVTFPLAQSCLGMMEIQFYG